MVYCGCDLIYRSGREPSIPAGLSLLQAGAGSVCRWYLHPDPYNVHHPLSVPSVPTAEAVTRALYLHSLLGMSPQTSNQPHGQRASRGTNRKASEGGNKDTSLRMKVAECAVDRRGFRFQLHLCEMRREV